MLAPELPYLELELELNLKLTLKLKLYTYIYIYLLALIAGSGFDSCSGVRRTSIMLHDRNSTWSKVTSRSGVFVTPSVLRGRYAAT